MLRMKQAVETVCRLRRSIMQASLGGVDLGQHSALVYFSQTGVGAGVRMGVGADVEGVVVFSQKRSYLGKQIGD